MAGSFSSFVPSSQNSKIKCNHCVNESGRHSLMSHLLRKHVHFCEPHCPLTKKAEGSPLLFWRSVNHL
ncbi:hypothetical protein FR265_19655 [Vibrio vulnificus]|nr:hypothetical protein [Vibrio vulnificus]